MATLSKRLELTDGVWQEIGPIEIVGQKDSISTVEMVVADSLPVGSVPEAQSIVSSDQKHYPAPAVGSLYVRCRNGIATFTYYEV